MMISMRMIKKLIIVITMGSHGCDSHTHDTGSQADFPAVFFHISHFDICHEIQLTDTNTKSVKKDNSHTHDTSS